jgi:hypothetical protein
VTLTRRLAAEGLGSLFLAAVVGSGVMAQRLAGGNVAIALLANTNGQQYGGLQVITVVSQRRQCRLALWLPRAL